MTAFPAKTREFVNFVLDSRRWNGFQFRDDDIVISTWSKSGTTLTQQIVGQLVFGGDPGVYGQSLSPWLDFRFIPAADVLAQADAQTHRRFLKTHLPVDALVFSPKAKYIYVGRDARDVFWSWRHHHSIFSDAAYDIMNPPDRTWPEFQRPDPDVHRAYRRFLEDGHPVFPFWPHVQSWWDIRHLPNVMLIHFNELRADLGAAIARIATFLDIDLEDALAKAVAENCSIERMKKLAAEFEVLTLVFDGGGENFINKGVNGRWKDVLTDEEVALCDTVAAENLTPDCAHWLATGKMPS